MAKPNIDPAFQGAPNLGGTSYDPIAFARRHKMEKFQIQKAKREEQEKATAQGLRDLMTDVKAWDDKKGFEEIMADQDRVINGFMELSRKGINLVSPKTTQDIMAYKAIQEEHNKIKQKADVYATQGKIYDTLIKAIEVDSALSPDQQRIEREESMKNIRDILKTDGILDRGSKLANAIVQKVDWNDIYKVVESKQKFLRKGTISQQIITNPDGSKEKRMVEDLSPEDEKWNIKMYGQVYDDFDPKYKAVIKKKREADTDPNFRGMSDKDYFIASFSMPYRKRFMDSPVGTGNGLSINFGGKQIKVNPGEFTDEEYKFVGRTYKDRFKVSTPSPIQIPIGLTGSTIYSGQDWRPLEGGSAVEGTITFYSIERDAFLCRSTVTQRDPFVRPEMMFEVPRKEFGDDADKFPIIVDGKTITLGEFRKKKGMGISSPAIKTIKGKDFRVSTPYIPKSK